MDGEERDGERQERKKEKKQVPGDAPTI